MASECPRAGPAAAADSGPPSLSAPPDSVAAVSARRPPPHPLQSLAGDDRHHAERGDGVGPPPAEGRVEPYTGEGNHREIGAERGLRRIGLEAPLPRAWATRRLARARTGMTTTERARITTPDRLRSGCSRCQGSCSVAPHPMIPAPTIPRRPTCSCSRTRHLADAASEPKPQGEIAHAGSGSLPAELRALRESRGGYERVPEHSACTQSAHIGFPHRLSQGCICC